jgi:hypothetical protein
MKQLPKLRRSWLHYRSDDFLVDFFFGTSKKKCNIAGFEHGLPSLHIRCPRAELAGKQ